MHYFENKLFAIEGPGFYISCRMSVSSHIYICADPVISSGLQPSEKKNITCQKYIKRQERSRVGLLFSPYKYHPEKILCVNGVKSWNSSTIIIGMLFHSSQWWEVDFFMIWKRKMMRRDDRFIHFEPGSDYDVQIFAVKVCIILSNETGKNIIIS